MQASKQLFRIIAFCAVIFLLFGISLSAYDSLITGYDTNNFIEFRIEEDTLKINGILNYDELEKGWIRFSSDHDNKVKFDADNGKPFSVELPLPKTKGMFTVQIYLAPKNSGYYYGYLTSQVVIEADADGVYRFAESPVAENNREMLSGWINPADCISEVSADIKAQSDSIVEGIESDYDKVFALYEWVVKNIYYDFDYYRDKTDSTTTAADEVLFSRRSVCAGYASILEALLHAQGIPAIITSTYALGASTDGNPFGDTYINAEKTNHAHVEAFVEGRWITMDATWSSNNKYQGGKKITARPYGYLYFDITPELFAMNHKILIRETASLDDTPTEWAKDEVWSAICADIVPGILQGNYREKISRGDFCKLIINMLCRRYEVADSAELLALSGIGEAENIFTDTDNKDIIAANLLGIVTGRGEGIFDPDSGITRQEAAVMLMRAAKAMGLETNTVPRRFTDTDNVPEWASEGIEFITSLMSSDGKLIMGGTSDYTFSPYDNYTVEQSILTALRLFVCK